MRKSFRFIAGAALALILFGGLAVDVAQARGCRGGGLRARISSRREARQERRDCGGRQLFQGRGQRSGGCGGVCELPADQAPELIRSPRDLGDEGVRLARQE